MPGILTYMAGRLLVMLFHAGVITNIYFMSNAVGALVGFAWIVSLVVVILVLRLGRKRSTR